MVAEYWTNMTGGIAQFYHLASPELGLYLMVICFSVFFAVFVGARTKNVMLSIFTFVSAMLIFGVMDLIPLWIVLIPTLIISAFIFYVKTSGSSEY